MGNISRQTSQGVSVRLSSDGSSSVQTHQSQRLRVNQDKGNFGPPLSTDGLNLINKTPFPALPDRSRFNRQYPGSNQNCPPVGLFPREPQFPGLDTTHGRQSFYKDAHTCNDAMRLLELARYESTNQLMPDVKSGDILNQAYQAALACQDALPLIGIAELENEKQLLPDVKAGDILREGYQKALKNQDPYALLEATRLENDKQLMPDIKAGDMLREAYQAALQRQDSSTLIDIAQFEQQHQLMKDIPAGNILRDAQQMFPNRPY